MSQIESAKVTAQQSLTKPNWVCEKTDPCRNRTTVRGCTAEAEMKVKNSLSIDLESSLRQFLAGTTWVLDHSRSDSDFFNPIIASHSG
jgi:hypothetical protein